MDQNRLTTRRPGGMAEVLILAYPTVITMFSFVLLGAADTIMVGRLGVPELAAVGLASIFCFTVLSPFMGMVEIVNTFASQSFGAGRPESCSRWAWQGVYVALLSWPLLGLGTRWLDELFRLLGPSGAVQSLGCQYGVIRLWGSGLFLVYLAVSNFLRGVGMVRTPMVVSVLVTLINVGLDYVLIFGKLGLPALGVPGAAWASNLALVVGVVLIFVVFLWPRVHRRFRTRSTFTPRWSLMLRLVRVGLPAGIHFFVEMASFMVFTAFIGRMGDVALAASQVAMQFMALTSNVNWGISVATTTLVGNYLGSKQPGLALRSTHSAFRVVVAYTLLMIAVVGLWPERMVALFSTDEKVITSGVFLIYLAVSFVVFDGLGLTAVGALRGAGDTTWPMMVSLIGAWGVFLPLAYLFGQVLGWGVVGAWLGCAIYIIGSSLFYLFRFRSGRWKTMASLDPG